MSRLAALVCLAGAAPALGSMWVVSRSRRYVLCVTPKTGLTEAMEFVHWLERPAEDVCSTMLLPELRAEVREQKCAGYKACGTLSNFTACDIDYNSIKTPTLQIFDHGNPWADPCRLKSDDPACTKFARLAIGRDPLSRLLSAYRNKMEESLDNETTFQQNYLTRYSLDQSVHPVTRYLRAVLATPDHQINIHFRSQASQCFDLAGANSRPFTYVADLNSPEDDDLDRLSAFMGSPQPWRSVISEHDVTNGAAASVKKLFCWEGCREHAGLISQLRNRFGSDIARLRDNGLHDFNESFNTMLDECVDNDRVCNSLHDSGPWSRTRGSTALATQGYLLARPAAARGAAQQPPSRRGAPADGTAFSGAAAAAPLAVQEGEMQALLARKAFMQGALTPTA